MIRFLRDAWAECRLELMALAFIFGAAATGVAFGVYDTLTRANVRNDLRPPIGVMVSDPDGLLRFMDAEAGVVCYSRDGYPEALDCLPIGETRLGP